MQNAVFSGLNFTYHVNFTAGSFYPLLGVGFAGAKTGITQRNGPTTLTAAFTNRNTTQLYNRQGFAVIGMGTRLFPESKKSFFMLEAGYRLGFAATNWSTDEVAADFMVNATTDE